MIKRLRVWLFKFIFGLDINHLVEFSQTIINMYRRIQSLEADLDIIHKAILVFDENMGGTNCSTSVSADIHELNSQVSHLTEVAQYHQDILEELEELTKLIEISHSTEIKDLN